MLYSQNRKTTPLKDSFKYAGKTLGWSPNCWSFSCLNNFPLESKESACLKKKNTYKIQTKQKNKTPKTKTKQIIPEAPEYFLSLSLRCLRLTNIHYFILLNLQSLNFFGINGILLLLHYQNMVFFLIHFNIILFHVEKKTHAAFPTRTCQGNISGMNRSKIGNWKKSWKNLCPLAHG